MPNIEEIYISDSKNYYMLYKPYWVEIAKNDLRKQEKSRSPGKFDILFAIIRNFPKIRTLDTAPIKFLIIHEADKMERVLQQALRRTMEKYNKLCRFILIADSISNIIDPIRSRCTELKLFPLTQNEFLWKIKNICDLEGISITDNALKLIYYYSNNDMNIAINTIQTAYIYSKHIDENLISKMIKSIYPMEIELCIQSAFRGDIIQAREILRNLFVKKGLTGKMILKLFSISLMNSSISEEMKKQLAIKLAELDEYISGPSTEEIQFTYFLTYLATLNITT
ncbi:MAG: hypothetical protein ACTSRP_10340 [Candidatus Helarchaeota archaeon]